MVRLKTDATKIYLHNKAFKGQYTNMTDLVFDDWVAFDKDNILVTATKDMEDRCGHLENTQHSECHCKNIKSVTLAEGKITIIGDITCIGWRKPVEGDRDMQASYQLEGEFICTKEKIIVRDIFSNVTDLINMFNKE